MANYNNCSYTNTDDTQSSLMKRIMDYRFAITDLTLYLDTHPNDTRCLCLHNDYCKRCRELIDTYQRTYGPLTIDCPCNKWRWSEEPWPWERGAS